MGDIVSGVLGGGSKTNQQVTVDPTTQRINRMRADQAQGLFGQAPLYDFGRTGGNVYAADPRVTDLYNSAVGTAPSPFDLAGYQQQGMDRSLFNEGLGVGSANLSDALGNAGQQYGNALNRTQGLYDAASGTTLGNYNNAIGAVGSQYAQSQAANQAQLQQALKYGTDAGSNYINQIARPVIQQQAALQGLEGGGAVPAAIAKATADIGLQYLSPLVQQGLGNQAQLGQQQVSTIAGLSGANAQQQAQLAGQNQQLQAGLAGENAATQAQLQQQYGQNVFGAYGNQAGIQNQFMQSLPGAYGTSITAPAQARSLAAQGAATLMPLADYGRSLQEQDLLRRQGLATTAFTGLPYTPQTTTAQRQSTQPLWNFFGQG